MPRTARPFEAVGRDHRHAITGLDPGRTERTRDARRLLQRLTPRHLAARSVAAEHAVGRRDTHAAHGLKDGHVAPPVRSARGRGCRGVRADRVETCDDAERHRLADEPADRGGSRDRAGDGQRDAGAQRDVLVAAGDGRRIDVVDPVGAGDDDGEGGAQRPAQDPDRQSDREQGRRLGGVAQGVAAAISALRNLLPPSGLTLRYLPANAPLEWLAESGLENLCILRHRRRPLLRFADGGKIEHLLRKSQNKICFNRLKKLGRVELVRFTSRNDIEAHFDQISEAYDLRRTAVNGLPVFRRDCLKKPFYLALMDQPGVLHATALKVGDQIVSMHFNGIAKKGVFLGLTAYDPLYGQNSPGKLHILLLAQMLKAEGFEQLDFTPGGDPFKEDFADASDDVSTLAVYPTVNARRLAVLRYAGEDVARTLLHRVSITPTTAGVQAKDLLQLGIGATFKTAARRSADWIASRQETKIYASDGAALPRVAANMTMRRNNLVDLLDCRLPSDELSRRPFVADALARIQQGQHLFTCIESGRLLCMAWLVEKVTKSIAEKLLPVIVPSDVPLAHDFFIAPTATGSGAAELLLRAMLQHAAGPAGDQQVLVAVPAHTALADYCAGAPALKYRGTVFRSRRLGRQRQWADTSPALG